MATQFVAAIATNSPGAASPIVSPGVTAAVAAERAMPGTCRRVTASARECTRNARSAWRCRVARTLATLSLSQDTTENVPTVNGNDVLRWGFQWQARAPPAA